MITVYKQGSAYIFELTEAGKKLSDTIAKRPEFAEQIEQMKRVKDLVGKRSGTSLKNLVYALFDAEVAKKPLGEIIQ